MSKQEINVKSTKKKKKKLGIVPRTVCTRMSKERKKKKKRKKENRKKEKNLGMVASTNSVEEVTERLRDVRG